MRDDFPTQILIRAIHKKSAKYCLANQAVTHIRHYNLVSCISILTNKIGNDEYCFTGNKITVSYNGSIARAFYQKNAFWASDDVNVLSLKEYELNKNIAMFLLVLIEKEKYRYNYGRKWDKELMLDSKILLPQKCGTPDWGYMDSYIQSIIKHSHLKYKELWDGCLDKSPL